MISSCDSCINDESVNCFRVLSLLLKSIGSAGRSASKLSLLQHGVIIFSLDAGMGLSLLYPDVILFSCDAGLGCGLRVCRGFGTGGTAAFNFRGAGIVFFLIGSGFLEKLLAREELLDRFDDYLPSLSTFHDVDSMTDTSSFTCSNGSDTTSWLYISGSKCSTSSSNGALDQRYILERSFGLFPNTAKLSC